MKTAAPVFALALALPLAARAGDPVKQASPADTKTPIVLGIGKPNGDELAKKAKADLEPYLTKALKRPVTVQIHDYDALTAALAKGTVDLAWIPPLAFVKASQENGEVAAIAKAMRQNELFYRAAFVVKKDSPAAALADLKGKKVAWVSQSSSSGYLFPRALLKSKGEDPAAFFGGELFAGDHPGVCKALREGKADVGATFSDEVPAGKEAKVDGCADAPPMEDFKVVVASGPIPNDVIAAKPDFDERLVDGVLAAFARMSQTENGKALLKDVFHADAWVVAVDGDFKAVMEVMDVKAKAKAQPAPEEKPAKAGKGKGKGGKK